MKRKPPAKPRRAPRAPAPRRRKGPEVDFTAEELEHWRQWLAREYHRPRSRRPSPQALNHATLRALQLLFHLLGLSPCQIEKITGVSHQHQRKLRLAAAGETDLHLSLHTFLLITNGLRVNPHRLLRHLLSRLEVTPASPDPDGSKNHASPRKL